MKRFFYTILGFSLLSSAVFLGGCGEKVKPGSSSVDRQEVTGVKVAEVRPTEATGYSEVAGTVTAKTTSVIASKVMGEVTSIRVKEGDPVKKGDLLLTIDDRDIREKIRGAEAATEEAKKGLEAANENLTLANLTYERYKKLYEGKAVSQQEFDTIGTQRKSAELGYESAREGVKRAESGVAEARVYLSYARVTSPVTGIVSEKKIDAGSMASPGMPLMVVEDTSSFELQTNADERLSERVYKGMAVEVAVDSLGKTFEGKVTEAVPSINPASRTFHVKIALKGTGLRSGLYGRVRFPLEKRIVLLLPASAIEAKGQLTGVYAVDDKGVVTYRLVRLGERYGDNIEILSGLNTGEKVIVEGVDKATDGGVIKTQK